jgi:hypothetical protein
MKNTVFWGVTQCCSCENWRFGRTYRLHHQSENNQRATASLAVTSNWSTLLPFHPDDGNNTFLRNIGSYISLTVSHPRIRHFSNTQGFPFISISCEPRSISGLYICYAPKDSLASLPIGTRFLWKWVQWEPDFSWGLVLATCYVSLRLLRDDFIDMHVRYTGCVRVTWRLPIAHKTVHFLKFIICLQKINEH